MGVIVNTGKQCRSIFKVITTTIKRNTRKQCGSIFKVLTTAIKRNIRMRNSKNARRMLKFT